MKTLCIVACHTNSALKIKSLVSNVKYFDEISDHIHIINSDEFKDQNIESLLKDYPDITYSYIPNSRLLCQGKWKNYLENNDYSDYDRIILTNDSFLLVQSLKPVMDKSQGYEMYGINDSREGKYHVADYFRVYTKSGIKTLLDYYDDRISKFSLVKSLEVIQKLEIQSTFAFEDYTFGSWHKINLSYRDNIFYDDEQLELLLKNGFPAIKLKKLQYTIYDNVDNPELPDDFAHEEYQSLHSDLEGFDKRILEIHFLQNGIKEGRPYKKGQKINVPEYLTKAVNKEISYE